MIDLQFKIIKGEVVRRGLEHLEHELPKISRDRIYRRVQRISMRMREEPPPKPGSRYRRTHTYSQGWPGYPQRAGTLGYKIENRTPYAKFVGGDALGKGQLPIHRQTGWPRFADVIEEEVEKLPKEIEYAIETEMSPYL